MDTVGNSLIKDIDIQEIISSLDGFYSYEMLAMHYCLTVRSRLQGQAVLVLKEALEERAEESFGHAKMLSERIGQLGEAVTGDPGRFVEISPISRFKPPVKYSEVGVVLVYILEHLRVIIRAYGEFLEGIKDKDVVTYHEVLGVLKDHIKHEAEIESFLNES